MGQGYGNATQSSAVQAKMADLPEEMGKLNTAEDADYGRNDLLGWGGSEPLDAAPLEEKINELNAPLRWMRSAERPDDLPTGGEPPVMGWHAMQNMIYKRESGT
jgi:hypothetical protein